MEEHVLLGVADEIIGSKHTSWNVNKIGGKPDWMAPHLGIGLPLCLQCQQPQILVVQISCPLENSSYNRALYVFCCVNKKCWISSKGWTVCRSQFKQIEKKSHKHQSVKLFDSWGDDDDDWEDNDKALNETQYLPILVSSPNNNKAKAGGNSGNVLETTSSLQALNLTDGFKTAPAFNLSFSQAETQFMFCPYYINVFDEKDCVVSVNDESHIEELIKKYQNCNENESEVSHQSNGFNVSCQENYEKDTKDELFHKFWKKINCFPTQIIRYSRCGAPVLFSDCLKDSLFPKCEYCGAKRVFEFQLMPALIPYLQLNMKDSEYIEFGTVLIYSCSKSCWDENPQSELCIYFADPDLKYFKSQNS